MAQALPSGDAGGTGGERERVLGLLRGHATSIQRRGLRRLRLFGSVARGEARADSDVDLVAELDPAVDFSLLDHAALEDELGRIVGRRVEITTAAHKLLPRVRASLERDAVTVF